MFIVMTKVQLQPGKIDTVRDLFAQTNPQLVANQPDWIEAKFTADRTNDQVTVLAYWRSAESYRTFSADETFRQTMSQFAPHFAGPPEITISEVLFEM